MKAQVTGMGSFQGSPTTASYLVINYLDRLEDGEGEASVSQYFGVFDPASLSWRDAHFPALPLLVPVTLSRSVRVEVTEVFRYANRPEVRTVFTAWATATNLEGTELDYTQLRPAPPTNGTEPLTMGAARQVLGYAPALGEAVGLFAGVLADLDQVRQEVLAAAEAANATAAAANATYTLRDQAAVLSQAGTEGQTAYLTELGEVWTHSGGRWQPTAQVMPDVIVSSGPRSGHASMHAYRLVQVTLTRRTTLNRTLFSVVRTQAAQFVEAALYSLAGVRLTTTGPREIPPVGLWEWGMTPVQVAPGLYYLLLASTSPTAEFGEIEVPGGASITLIKPGTVTPPPSPDLSAAGGTLGARTYTYSLSYITDLPLPASAADRVRGETQVSPPSALALAAQGGVRVAWPAAPAGVTHTRIYGRDTAAGPLTLLAEVDAAMGQWTDDGSVPPSSTLQNYVNTSGLTQGLPLPVTLPLAEAGAVTTAPALTVLNQRLPRLTVPPVVRDIHPIHVYGADRATQQPYGWDQSTGRIVKSFSSGEDWVQLMPLPSGAMLGNGNLSDMLVHAGRLYVLSSTLGLCRSSDLTAQATWENIACPTGSNLRHPTAIGRPVGMEILNGHLWMLEYSQAGAEFGEPGNTQFHVLRLNLATMQWALSGRFKARHGHSFFTFGSQLWMTAGDHGWGPGVGVWVLDPGGIGTQPEGLDGWRQWTRYGQGIATGHSDHYLIEAEVLPSPVPGPGGVAVQPGIIGASDRPGWHLLHVALGGSEGAFNVNGLTPRPPALNGEVISGETVAGVALDNLQNAYYWTQESGRHGIWVSPPPYSQTMLLQQVPQQFFITRTVKSGGRLLNDRWLILPGRFEGQA